MLTNRQAQQKYGVPRNTIGRRKDNRNPMNPGRPTALSKEEDVIARSIIVAAKWGFPFTTYDLKHVVNLHLDRRGVNGPYFKSNTPGKGWVSCFLKRHGDLSARMAENIKREWAGVTPEGIAQYFENLKEELKDIPRFAQPVDRKHLIIMDNHDSHIQLESLNYAREKWNLNTNNTSSHRHINYNHSTGRFLDPSKLTIPKRQPIGCCSTRDAPSRFMKSVSCWEQRILEL